MSRPRVLLAEDHPGMAAELRRLLEPEVDVVAVVDDGRALLHAVGELRPDLVVTDLVMPGLDGIAAARALRARHPGLPVVIVTIHGTAEMVDQAYAAGALAYVLKLAAAQDLLPAVRAALRGKRYTSSSIDVPGPLHSRTTDRRDTP
jgi:DNA-binding NarL/FixJ family response regulator